VVSLKTYNNNSAISKINITLIPKRNYKKTFHLLAHV